MEEAWERGAGCRSEGEVRQATSTAVLRSGLRATMKAARRELSCSNMRFTAPAMETPSRFFYNPALLQINATTLFVVMRAVRYSKFVWNSSLAAGFTSFDELRHACSSENGSAFVRLALRDFGTLTSDGDCRLPCASTHGNDVTLGPMDPRLFQSSDMSFYLLDSRAPSRASTSSACSWHCAWEREHLSQIRFFENIASRAALVWALSLPRERRV